MQFSGEDFPFTLTVPDIKKVWNINCIPNLSYKNVLRGH